MQLFLDKDGKLSAKRVFGASLLTVGVVFAIILFWYSLTSGAKDAMTAKSIIDMFLIAGGSMIGVSVFERFKK